MVNHIETTKILSVAKILFFLIIKNVKMNIFTYFYKKIHANKATCAIRIIGAP